jgi:hypothetical protein
VAGAIYVLKDGDQLVEMKEQAYDSEELLQALLAQYPDLMAGDQIDSSAPRRWLLIKREKEVPSQEDENGRWSIIRGRLIGQFLPGTYGTVEIRFQVLQGKPPFSDEGKRIELLERLNQIPGVSAPATGITKRPSIRLSLLKDPATLQQFLSVLDWLVKVIKREGLQE